MVLFQTKKFKTYVTNIEFLTKLLNMTSTKQVINLKPLHHKNASKSCPAGLAVTCSKLTIETLEQGVKYVQS